MRRPLLVFLVALVLTTAAPVSAQPQTTYYELVELIYTIHADRTLSAHNNYVICNPDWRTWRHTITYKISTENTSNVHVWGDGGDLTYEVNRPPGKTEITIRFTLSGGSTLTYHVTFTADNLVSGTGPTYKSKLGGITLGEGDYPYQRYIVRIQGPAGSNLFLKNPDNAQVLENDPPTVQYETSVGAPGSFDGLLAYFYSQPVYFKLTLTDHFTNLGSENSREVWLYSILFAQMDSQFAALASSPPLEAMYVDDDNNWHAVFDIGTIQAGASRTENIEVIFELNVHESGATESNTGSIEDIPAELPSYENYLREDEYWEVDDPLILENAQEIRGGENNAYLLAKNIIEWVGEEIEYEIKGRQGALETLKTKKGDCDCFSDLTIALSRAAGLPARMSSGWVYENAELSGHAWVEFYLPNHGWQPADPTWAKNSGNYLGRLDPIHLLQNTQGLSSTWSVSRVECYGSIPQLDENRNLVLLTPSQAAEEFIASAEITIDMAEQLLGEELTDARSLLDQTSTADTDTKISLAKQALGQANETIRELGKAPEREAPEGGIQLLLPGWLIWICVGIVAAGIVAIVGIKLRSRSQYRSISISTETF